MSEQRFYYNDFSTFHSRIRDIITNISTNAVRFATREYVLNGSNRHMNEIDEGSENGAFRHALWQASIAAIHGNDIARTVGAAHEKNPEIDLRIRTFNSLSEADQTADLLNNIIGRDIARRNKTTNMRDLAFLVLDEFRYKGLYTVVLDKNGIYHVVRHFLDNEKYEKLKLYYNNVDKNGFRPYEK